MKSAWTAAGRAFRFDAGPLSGMLERSAYSRLLTIALGGLRIGALGGLAWRMERDGSTGSVHPLPDVAYIQQPYVVAPFVLETPPEFRLTAFFRATDQGIDGDFRLATVWPVSEVSLELFAEWPAGGYRPIVDFPTSDRPCDFPGVQAGIVEFGGGSAALFTDVGEHGQLQTTSTGATLKLFDQSLEKGVILVGRFALRPAVDSLLIKRDLDDWLDHPSASL